MHCTNCGAELPAHETTCPDCGGAAQQPAASKPDIEYVGLGPRALAFLVDALLGCVLPIVIALVVARTLTQTGLWGPTLAGPLAISGGVDMVAMWNSMGWMQILAVNIAFNLAQGLLYFSLCHSSPWQATVGKRWRHLIVTDKNGTRIGFLRALIRAFVKTCLSYFHVFGLAIQVAQVGSTKRKQAIHDFIAKTVVVKGRSPAGARLGYWRVALFVLVPPLFLLTTCIVIGDFQILPG